MLSAIASARESIYIEMYSFNNDTEGFNFSKELRSATRRGLKVIVVLDILGSHAFRRDAVDQLKVAGVEVLYYSFFLRRTHRKILIVDEKIAFIGGVNIRRRYKFWRDLHIQVSGHVVRPILYSFAKVYAECGGKDELLKSEIKRDTLSKTKLWFIEHGVGRKEHFLRTYYKDRLDSARETIVFVTPYLLPPRWFIARLHQAKLRGVNVEILLPSDVTDHRIANKVNRSYAAFFSKLGVRCFFNKGMNHAKAILIDRKEGMIGSQNLDILSFNWNSEAGVFFHEPDMVADLVKIIEGWKREAVLFKPGQSKFHWYDIPIAFFLRLFGFLPLW